MNNKIEQIALQNDMSIEFVNWFFNEKKAGCGNVWFMMMAAMWEGWQGRSIEMDKLAAENVALKNAFGPGDSVLNFLTIALRHTTYDRIDLDDVTLAFKMSLPETPATDRIVAGIKADGVEMFVRRLQQCVDEGDFVGDEVAVIVGAIDCGKEFCEQLREGAK